MNADVEFPERTWVSNRISSIVTGKLMAYSEINKVPVNVLLQGKTNGVALCDSYLYDYYLIYKFRLHADVAILVKEIKHLTDLQHGAPHDSPADYWSDKVFAENLIAWIVSGMAKIEGFELRGALTDEMIKPLLSLTPPMEQEVIIEMHNKFFYILAERLYSLYNLHPDEVFVLAHQEVIKILIAKTRQYTLSFEARNDRLSPLHFISSVSDYDLWYTPKGTYAQVTRLTESATKKIDKVISECANAIDSDSYIVSSHEMSLAEKKYNALLDSLRFYWKYVDFTAITDAFILDELAELGKLGRYGVSELTPAQRTLEGTMTIKSEGKYLKNFTMRQIALGMPNKDAGLMSALSYDYDGVTKNLHSTTFERMIRKLPDKVEARLYARIKEISESEVYKMNLAGFFKCSVEVIIKEFLLKSTNAVKTEFIKGIINVLSGSLMVSAVNLRGKELSDLIAIRGAGEGASCRFLLVSIATGDCRIVNQNNDDIYDESALQSWLLQHLSAYDKESRFIKLAFNRFRVVISANMVFKILNIDPLTFHDTADYTDELRRRRVNKMRSDTDTLINTSDEKSWNYFLDFMVLSSSVLPLVPAITALGFILQYVIGTTIITATEIIRFYSAKNEDYRVDIFWSMLANLLTGVLFNAKMLVNAFKKNMYSLVPRHRPGEKLSLRNLPYASLAPQPVSETYRKLKNLVASGTNGNVYNLDQNFVMKDYKRLLRILSPASGTHDGKLPRISVYNNSLLEANTSAVAMNRLYGKGSARVIIYGTEDAFTKSVSLKMLKINGKSLSRILAEGNREILDKMSAALTDEGIARVVRSMLKGLKEKGIAHNDINLANIIYDDVNDHFALVDFDSATITPLFHETINMLGNDKYDLMAAKLTGDLRDFSRLCK